MNNKLDSLPYAQKVAPRIIDEEIILLHMQNPQLKKIIKLMKSLSGVHYSGKRLRLGTSVQFPCLFSGPPSTGKTMAAEVLAVKLKLPMYRIDLSQVVSKYIGETEKNLRRIFDAADVSDMILFFDEADALFGKRTGVKDAHDRHANIEISYFLERIEQFKGLAILATNLKDDLDESFLKRIRYIIYFPLPETEQREKK
ncbi:MAG: ATP-binding protein [Candidatus Aminicenantes bacterium]|nr:MAG: ATP-binding protein [Candidatus Aminicenantes bacterium]